MQSTREGLRTMDRKPGLWASGFGPGVIAGVAMTLVLFAYRLATGMPTPQEALAERMVRLLSYQAFALILATLQHTAKPLGFVAAVLTSLVGFGIGGVVYTRVAEKGRYPRLVRGMGAGAVTWVFLTYVFLPIIQGGFLGVPLTTVVSAPALPLALGSLFYGFLLAVLGRQPGHARTQEAPPASGIPTTVRTEPSVRSRPTSRRDLLRLATLILLGSTAASLGVWKDAAVTRGAALASWAVRLITGTSSSENEMPPEVTPNGRFYRISKNYPFDPRVDVAKWTLSVTGLVARPLALSYAEFLKAAPSAEHYHTLECIANEVGGDLISNALWTGVRMKDVLDLAGLQAGAKTVVMRSADNYAESVPLEVALDPTTLLAYKMNGAPLPQDHGAPVRVLIANRYGMKQPKWLTSLEVVNPEFTGYWGQQGRSIAGIVKTNSAFSRKVRDGAVVVLGGWAFAGSRGISKVEISADGGKTWWPAAVKEALGENCWQFWSTKWTPPAPGEYSLKVRAIDGRGLMQAGVRKRLPDGAEGYHEVLIRVAGES
jgi:DMSO/TMAO reductase YedYZ molybdopterin-dependent catalytic subunit